jgi:SAM-dependent methyltransferase
MGTANKIIEKIATVIPQTRPAVIALYKWYTPKEGWNAQHPFDRTYGVDTSGLLPSFLIKGGESVYGAAQPSIISAALATIPNVASCNFVDLGCGKGRPLIIAASAGFKTVTGVEFTPTLARTARRNAASYRRMYPNSPLIDVITGDALEYRFPEGPTALFLYNPFDANLTGRVIKNIEASLQQAPRDFYVICYNPVCAALFDASPALERRFAAQIPYDERELAFGPDDTDGVAVWQNRGNQASLPPGTPNAPIKVTIPRWRAEVEPVHA